jgi:hypothetical protein
MSKASGVDLFENIAIPEGDPGEQLVAYLLLSPIVCQLYSLPKAIACIAQAQELAVRLAGQSITYRPKTPSKFACLEFELQEKTEIVLLSLINSVLVMPSVGPSELSKLLLTEDMVINLTNLRVVHFMLRLRTRSLVAALEHLRSVESAATLADSTRRILAKCFYREIISEEPLDRADDCFMLARALIRNRNLQLAAVALKNADNELNSYTPFKKDLPSVQKIKEQIAAIVKELGSGAA